MQFSYENYINLAFHLDRAQGPVPQDISKRIVSNAIAPVITVTSTPSLDKHVQETFNIDSMYMLLRFFGGCTSDRDQANECDRITIKGESSEMQPAMQPEIEINTNDNEEEAEAIKQIDSTSSHLPVPTKRTRRSRSNSLFQRDATQSQFIRFTKPIEDLINSRDSHDMLFDYHSLEVFLECCLSLVEKLTDDDTEYKSLKNSIYHRFFSSTISSTTYLSPYESFNHPIVAIIAIDISNNETYDDARNLLIKFKNQHNTITNYPTFINTNDILPVFLLCYDEDSTGQLNSCHEVAKKLKKQLFVESIILPLWSSNYLDDDQVFLHQPVMSSLDEILFFFQSPTNDRLPLKLINILYDLIENLVLDLMIPFVQRKISFWDETILQPRKSLFHGNKLFRRFMGKSSTQTTVLETIAKDSSGNEYFTSSSNEFLLRKLADWSMMISDFKTAYSTYDTLIADFENYPKYLATCLEWCAVCILMGAQNIVTVKMIKNDVNPLIVRSLDAYEECASLMNLTEQNENSKSDSTELARSYETRCMLLTSELFLSLNDTWTSTPYALSNLETILSECKLGPCSQIMIWERLSDCYNMRIDPRIRHRVENSTVRQEDGQDLNQKPLKEDILSKGLTRKRKAAFFRLLSAKKWSEQKQWRQVSWCLRDIENIYSGTVLANRKELIYEKLKIELNSIKMNSNKKIAENEEIINR